MGCLVKDQLDVPSFMMKIFQIRLHSFNSVFTAEFYTTCRALLFLRQQSRHKYLLCTNSLSALQNLWGHTPDHRVVLEILQQVLSLHEAWTSVAFCWVLGHTGMSGNRAADPATNEAALLETSDFRPSLM
jgi:ribonuclease HI